MAKETAANETAFVDWNDLKVQDHWYKIRHEIEDELHSATSDIRKQFEVRLKLNTATIVSDGDRSVLRVPVSAIWRNDLEQTIAAILVSSTTEDEPRIAAIAHNVAELLQRWILKDVPVGASPEFLYPEPEVRWPDEAESQDATAVAINQATVETTATE